MNLTEQDYELLSAYIDEMLAEHERQSLESRMNAEPELRRELAAMRQTVQLVSQLPTIKAPRSFALTPQMVGMAPDAVEIRTAPKRRIIQFPVVGVLSAVASLIITLAGVGLLLSGGDNVDMQTSPSQPEAGIFSNTTTDGIFITTPEGVAAAPTSVPDQLGSGGEFAASSGVVEDIEEAEADDADIFSTTLNDGVELTATLPIQILQTPAGTGGAAPEGDGAGGRTAAEPQDEEALPESETTLGYAIAGTPLPDSADFSASDEVPLAAILPPTMPDAPAGAPPSAQADLFDDAASPEKIPEFAPPCPAGNCGGSIETMRSAEIPAPSAQGTIMMEQQAEPFSFELPTQTASPTIVRSPEPTSVAQEGQSAVEQAPVESLDTGQDGARQQRQREDSSAQISDNITGIGLIGVGVVLMLVAVTSFFMSRRRAL